MEENFFALLVTVVNIQRYAYLSLVSYVSQLSVSKYFHSLNFVHFGRNFLVIPICCIFYYSTAYLPHFTTTEAYFQ